MTCARNPHPHLRTIDEVLHIGPWDLVREHVGPDGPIARIQDLRRYHWTGVGARTSFMPNDRDGTYRMLKCRILVTYDANTTTELAAAAVAGFTQLTEEVRKDAAQRWAASFERYLGHATSLVWRDVRTWMHHRRRPVEQATIDAFAQALLAHVATQEPHRATQLRAARLLLDSGRVDWAPIGLPLAHSEYGLQAVAVRLAVTRAAIMAVCRSGRGAS